MIVFVFVCCVVVVVVIVVVGSRVPNPKAGKVFSHHSVILLVGFL